MTFPPAEEDLDVPSEPIGEGNLLSGEVMAIRSDPVIDAVNPVTDEAHFFLGNIDAGCAQQNDGIIENHTARLYRVGSEGLSDHERAGVG